MLVQGVGDFHIPNEPESRRHDSEITAHGICGRYDPELAHNLGEWGDRCGQEYSYLGRTHLEDVRTVLDIGANIGAFSVWASRIWWPNRIKMVHLYEPNESLMPFLIQNANLIQSKYEIHQVAVTVDHCPVFYEHDESGRSHTWGDRFSQGRDGNGWKPGRPVRGLHPRDLPQADCLKMDCEGTEGEIVHHYQHWDRLRVVMAEWHSHENRVELFRACSANSLVLKKNDCGEAEQGVGVWVRA